MGRPLSHRRTLPSGWGTCGCKQNMPLEPRVPAALGLELPDLASFIAPLSPGPSKDLDYQWLQMSSHVTAVLMFCLMQSPLMGPEVRMPWPTPQQSRSSTCPPQSVGGRLEPLCTHHPPPPPCPRVHLQEDWSQVPACPPIGPQAPAATTEQGTEGDPSRSRAGVH